MRKASLTVPACAILLWTGAAQAVLTGQQRCEQAKLKAQGALQTCLKTNSANLIAGKADASAACQTKFTTALARADATATRLHTSCRYIDNGDGTVSDLNTGLMWEKKTGVVGTPNPTDIHDVNNLYLWCIGTDDSWPNCTNPSNPPDGTAFTDFLGSLNWGTRLPPPAPDIAGCFANHCDWRLPSYDELKGIIDTTVAGCGSTGPCINPVFGPTAFLSTPPHAEIGCYLTITGEPEDTVHDYFWLWSFDDGMLYHGPKMSVSADVRAVRGGL